MDSFNRTVLGIAIVILILALTYVGIMMVYYKQKITGSNGAFPSSSATCPDYWLYDGTYCTPDSYGTNVPPNFDASKSQGIFGVGGKNGFNPNDKTWNVGGKSAICNQRAWANANSILWDGVSNYTGCPK
jgi:hypothetical protein